MPALDQKTYVSFGDFFVNNWCYHKGKQNKFQSKSQAKGQVKRDLVAINTLYLIPISVWSI